MNIHQHHDEAEAQAEAERDERRGGVDQPRYGMVSCANPSCGETIYGLVGYEQFCSEDCSIEHVKLTETTTCRQCSKVVPSAEAVAPGLCSERCRWDEIDRADAEAAYYGGRQ